MTTITDQARLWQLISPTLPVGAFSYSQGLEQAVHCGWVSDEATSHAWIEGVLEHGMSSVDIPVIKRVHSAWRRGDATEIARWDAICHACRETDELRKEDRNMGGALKRLTLELGDAVPDVAMGFAAAYAVVAANWSVPARDAAAGYAWAWCENQVAAAIKLVPLGHSAGQRLLRDLAAKLEGVVERGMKCSDDELGMSLPGLAIASARHETQYTRLFRS